MSVELYDDDGLLTPFVESISDLKAETVTDFKQAKVISGTWIFYTYTEYNDEEAGGGPQNYKIIEEGTDMDSEAANISTVNGSMYLLPDEDDGVILFQHPYYAGNQKHYQRSCRDVMKYFFADSAQGASSAIVLDKHHTFTVFSKTGFDGFEFHLQNFNPGQYDYQYETTRKIGFGNDMVQSIRRE